MKPCKVVTEGETDLLILQALLEISHRNRPVEFMAAGGWSGADSLARSILVRGESDVALVVDADSTDLDRIEARRQFLQMSLGSVASHSEWRVFVMVPETEGLLFIDQHVLENLIGHNVIGNILDRGRLKPKKMLQELTGRELSLEFYQDLLPRLRSMDLSRIRNQSPLAELAAFVNGVTKSRKPSSRRPQPRLTPQ